MKISDSGVYGKNITALVMFLFVWTAAMSQSGMTHFHLGNSDIPDNSVYAIHIDPANEIWVGTDNGLGRFDGVNWTTYRTSNSGLPSNYVRSIVTDDSGFVWVGTATNGLARFDGQDWVAYNTGNSILPDDFVKSLAAIPGGGIWIGTTGGAVHLDNGIMTVYNYLAQGSESNNVASIGVEDTNVVWFGMVNGGLIRQSDTGFVDYTINNSALTDNTILGIAMEGDDLWMATPANGVIYYWNLAFISYHPFNSGSPSASYNSVVEDAVGDLWFGSVDSGIVHYDRSVWRSFNTYNSAFPQDYVRCVAYDSLQDAIWVGTHSEGLVKMTRSVVLRNDSPNENGGLKVFPQPAKGQLTIVKDGMEALPWQWMDLQGRILENGQFHGVQMKLELGNYPPGSYLLRIGNQVRKVIVDQ